MNAYLRQAQEDMESAARGMDTSALRRHPSGKWSSAEIMEHLSRAFASTTKLMARHLDSGEPARDTATWRQRLRTLIVIDVGYFPKGTKAPEFTLPKGLDAEQALSQFRETLVAMDKAITDCEQKFGSGTKFASHAIFGPLTARQWRRFHRVHTRHHAKQVAALKNGGW